MNLKPSYHTMSTGKFHYTPILGQLVIILAFESKSREQILTIIMRIILRLQRKIKKRRRNLEQINAEWDKTNTKQGHKE